MKKQLIILGIIVLLLAVGLSGCIVGPIINDTGTVTYMDFEGGFYAIIGAEDYDPLNLADEFKVEGLQVRFKAVMYNGPTFHMWGFPIILIEIEKINITGSW